MCEDVPSWQGFDDNFHLLTPEYIAQQEKECGKIEEAKYLEFDYPYWFRYDDYMKGSSWEIVLYYSDEVFQTEEYDDDAIKKESKLVFRQVGN